MRCDLQHPEQGKARLALGGALTLDSANELRDILRQALDSVSELTVELAHDTEADLSCLQLLCSAHQTAINAGQQMSLCTNNSQQFQEVSCLAGLCRHQKCAIRPQEKCLLAGGKL